MEESWKFKSYLNRKFRAKIVTDFRSNIQVDAINDVWW